VTEDVEQSHGKVRGLGAISGLRIRTSSLMNPKSLPVAVTNSTEIAPDAHVIDSCDLHRVVNVIGHVLHGGDHRIRVIPRRVFSKPIDPAAGRLATCCLSLRNWDPRLRLCWPPDHLR
jgi:hypothetical protein